MSALKHITDAEFTTIISEGITLVDFWAPWCGPCKALNPILEEVATELGEKAKIVKLDIDQNPEAPSQFGITSIPTLLLFKDGKKVNQKIGTLQKNALKEFIESAL